MVQFQKDERLYERVDAETSLYFYRNRNRFSDWQVVIIYPSRNTEQSDIYPHRSFLNGGQVHRVYLNELGDIRQWEHPNFEQIFYPTPCKGAAT